MSNSILRFSVLFLLLAVILSAVGSYITSIFDLMGFSTSLLNSGNTHFVFENIVLYFGWFLDVLFLNGASDYTTLVTAPTISIGGIAWVLSLVRFIFGLGIVILIASLIFGRIRD